MLAPHHGENAQLSVAWLAPKNLEDFGVFLRREVVLLDQLRRDGWLSHAHVLYIGSREGAIASGGRLICLDLIGDVARAEKSPVAFVQLFLQARSGPIAAWGGRGRG